MWKDGVRTRQQLCMRNDGLRTSSQFSFACMSIGRPAAMKHAKLEWPG